MPASVQLIPGNVTEIDLHGTDFDMANVVGIGPLRLQAVPSAANGTLIRVAIPASVPSGGEAPPSRWTAGRYPVTVMTSKGTSDTLMLAIVSPGTPP